ncbi:MAG: hypothetical protein ACR2JU_04030 [Nocardioidaceae bacterium]
MTESPKRPITPDDCNRVLLLLDALERIAVDREPGALWEVLAEVHDQYGSDVMRTPLPDEDRVGDVFAAAELHFARILLEAVYIHGGQIPERVGRGVQTICVTPGCPHPAVLAYCLSCELAHGEGTP